MSGPYQNTNKVVLLAKIEGTEGQDAGPTPALDAFLVSAADVKPNTTALNRDNYTPSLSKNQGGIGRTTVTMTFTHELKASGVFGVAPKLGRLLKACGFAETVIPNTAAATISAAAGGLNTGPAVAFAATTAPTSRFDKYRIYITTGGASGAAKGLILSDGFHEGDTAVADSLDFSTQVNNRSLGTTTIDTTSPIAPVLTVGGTWAVGDVIEQKVFGTMFSYQVTAGNTTPSQVAAAIAALIAADGRYTAVAAAAVITLGLEGTAVPITLTTATPVTLGSSGAAVTPTWAGNLVVGDYYDITLRRPGVRYDPVSTGIPSLTMYMYLDGSLHKCFAMRGTFKIDGKSSEFAKVAFTFTGSYEDPNTAPLPTGMIYEPSKPYKCELMQFVMQGMPNQCGDTWSIDLGGTVTPRDCYNANDGFDGVLFTDRRPTLSADPESTTPDKYNLWRRLKGADQIRTHMVVGQRGGIGNLVHFNADSGQYTKPDYKDRNKIRAWDLAMDLNSPDGNGDNEMYLTFA